MNMQDNRIDDQTLERQPVGTDADGIPSLSTAPANPPDPTPAPLPEQIDAACNRIAPVWPLDRFVAVNPFHGLRDQRFEQAAETMRRIAGARMYMPRSYYREQIEAGRITDEDLDAAAARCGSDLSAADLRQAAAVDAKPASASPAAPQPASQSAAPQAAPQAAPHTRPALTPPGTLAPASPPATALSPPRPGRPHGRCRRDPRTCVRRRRASGRVAAGCSR